MAYFIGYVLGLVTALAFAFGPGLWRSWQESGEVPPLSEWTSGRRSLPPQVEP